MGYRDEVRQRTRGYFVQVLVWLPVSALLAGLGVTFASGMFAGSPNVVAVLAIAAMLVVVGGALAIHRANVRCPSCNAWLVPGGVNGFSPSTCPSCKADLRG